MTAAKEQWSWRHKIIVPDVLLQGNTFDRYDDESNTLDVGCHVRVDDYGFFIVWEPKGKEAGILDLTQVWETRPSGGIKDARILAELEQRYRATAATATSAAAMAPTTTSMPTAATTATMPLLPPQSSSSSSGTTSNAMMAAATVSMGGSGTTTAPTPTTAGAIVVGSATAAAGAAPSLMFGAAGIGPAAIGGLTATAGGGAGAGNAAVGVSGIGIGGGTAATTTTNESLEERTVWLTYGQDLVLVSSLYLVAANAQIAREWRAVINDFLRSYKFRFACPMHCLQKHWRFLCLATNERGRIPLRNIVRTFASGKPEKMVHKCLADLGLSGDKCGVVVRRRSRLGSSVSSSAANAARRTSSLMPPPAANGSGIINGNTQTQPPPSPSTSTATTTYHHKRGFLARKISSFYRCGATCGRTTSAGRGDGQQQQQQQQQQKQRDDKESRKCRSRRRKEREDLEVGLFTFDKFLRLYHKICPRTDIQEMFVRLSGQKEYLTRERLVQFLNEEQRDPRLNEILFPHFDQDRVQQIIAKYETDESYIAQGKMSGDGFLRFLLSDENSPVFLDRTDLYQDMDQPLCHYFINSSHNTYLTGRQYGGKSSTEIYRQVLLAGCRCIELDCWDGTGENKGEPIITHGKAMCTDVFFRDVLFQIRETAFLRTDSPVILSFENHCSKSNQLKMAKYCLEILGEMLLTKPLDDCPLEPGYPLPSPNRLRRKILIKNKRLKKEEERRQMEEFLSQGRLLDEEEEQSDMMDQQHGRVLEHPSQVVGETETTTTATIANNSEADAAAAGCCEPPNATGGSAHGTPPPASGQHQKQQCMLSPPVTGSSGLISDQRAHPEEDLSSAGATAHPPTSNKPYPLHIGPGGKLRLGPTVSSASLCTGAELSSAAGSNTTAAATAGNHRSSLSSAAPSRQNSAMALTSGMTTPNAYSISAVASTGDLLLHQQQQAEDAVGTGGAVLPPNRAMAQQGIMSKLRQPLGLGTRKVQPALTKEEEERLFKLIQESYHYQGATTNIHPLLSSLINYMHPVKFSGFDVAEQNDLHFHMSSFSESTGLGLLKQSAPEWVNYNKRQLSRIYPKGARVDSSNFLPQIFWNAGCQMVALNFQTPDVCMQLNQGKFEYNGMTGYLLKPEFMRRPDRSFDPFSESPVDGVIAAHCSVRIVSGQFLCERKVGTYVEVEMYGLPTDTIRKEHRTKLVPANGLNPVYNEEPFVFRKVILPELAVLRFAVYDENGKQLGQRILPLDGLQSGYRHIALRTENNQPLTLPTLFVHLQLKTYVPDELSGLVDALADPRAYLSAQEKREEALQQMGVDELDDLMPQMLSDQQLQQPQQQQLQLVQGGRGGGAGLATKCGAIGLFDGNASIRRPLAQQNGGGGGGVGGFQSQQNMAYDSNRGSASQSPCPGANATTTKDQLGVSGASGGGTGRSGGTMLPDSHSTQTIMEGGKFQVELIDIGELRKEKAFVKLQKRAHKEREDIRRRHQKQRDSIAKSQQSSVEKLVADQLQGQCAQNKLSLKKRNHLNNTSLNAPAATAAAAAAATTATAAQNQRGENKTRHFSLGGRVSDPGDQKIRSLVQNQTDEWSQLLRRLELELFEQRKHHIHEEYELLRRLLVDRQKQQLIALRARFELESKELKQAQTKKSMDDIRAVQQDKGIKTKAERDRRIKELNEKNVKLFVEERKRLATRCRRHEEQLEKRHSEQLEALEKEEAKSLELEEMSHRECLLASQPQCVV